MRIRRRFTTSGKWTEAWDRVRTRVTGWAAKIRLPKGRAWEWLRSDGGRFGLMAGGVFLAMLVAGYLVAALVFFPAPIFASSRTVPRLIGVEAETAREALRAAGLSIAETDRIAHPDIADGSVAWQDPPPRVVVPEGSEVRITLSAGPQRIPVPDVAGYDATNARLLIESAGLAVGRVESAQAPTPANVTVNTRPPAGTILRPGGQVTLVVSIGAATVRVPRLIGLTLDSARVVLEEAGLALGTNYARSSNAAEAGQIFFQEPAPGTLGAPGSQVNVILVSGNPP